MNLPVSQFITNSNHNEAYAYLSAVLPVTLLLNCTVAVSPGLFLCPAYVSFKYYSKTEGVVGFFLSWKC